MSEGIPSDDGFIALHVHAGDLADQTAGGNESLCDDARLAMEEIFSRTHGHDHFFQGTVSGSFADAIDRALNLPGLPALPPMNWQRPDRGRHGNAH